MKITHLRIRNYRTLESIDLAFPSSYAAICGPNDCGKTNIVRAMRALAKADPAFRFFDDDEEDAVSINDDYPKWKDTKPPQREINFELMLSVQRDRDAGLFQFLIKQLSADPDAGTLDLSIAVTYRTDPTEPDVAVTCQGQHHGGIDAQQVLKQLSSRSILFHNSTQIDLPAPFRAYRGGMSELPPPNTSSL